jgi:uncharacterized protein YuzE
LGILSREGGLVHWTFDGDAGALYLYLSDVPSARQVEVVPGLIVDFDASGEPTGIECLSLAPDLPLEELNRLGVREDGLAMLSYLALSAYATATGRVLPDGGAESGRGRDLEGLALVS